MSNNLNTYFMEASNTEDEVIFVQNCAICGEKMLYDVYAPYLCICDKCKQAVMYIREQME